MTLIVEWDRVDMTDEQTGVWDTIYTEDELIPFLQFKETEGTAYAFERESVNPTASTVSDEGDLADSDIQFSEKTATLRTVYVQNYLNLKKKALAKKQDPLAILQVKMSKSYGRKIADLVINGDSAVDDTEFDGLEKICRLETRMMAMDDGAIDGPGTAETELTLARLRETIDMVEMGKPTCLIMNKKMRRKLTNLMYAAGGGISLASIEMFGKRVEVFDSIPIVINDYISNAETYADASTWPSSTATTIYAAKFGEESQGFTLLHNGPFFNVGFQNLGIRKNRNEEVWRLIGYPGSCLYSTLVIAALGGIDSSA
jgi:hypothetical protein